MRKANKATLKYFTLFIILGFILAATGCVSPMAINKKTQNLDISKESIVLLTLRATNEFLPINKLIVEYINVRATVSGKKFSFKVKDPISLKFLAQNFYDYFISIKLPPNEYTIWRISGKGWLDECEFSVPLKIDFYLEPNTVVYLGHMEMINRNKKRGEGEKRLGFLQLPLYDQNWNGLFYNGTIDISISDNYDEDIAFIKQNYPVLKNYTVKKGIIKPEEENKGPTPPDPTKPSALRN